MVRVAVALLLLPLMSSAANAQSRIALLIGNQGYSGKVQPLKNPHNDIRTIEAALTSVGFKVNSLADAGRRQMLTAVKTFAAQLAKGGPNAVGFLYYSGHGVARPEDRANYLIPVDVKDTGSTDFWFDAVKLDDILGELERAAPFAAHFVVFDACRDDLKLPYKSASKGFEPVAERSGMFIAFATALGAVALDEGKSGGSSGPYSSALANELVKPGQDHLQLFQNVKEGVFASTARQQVPWERNGLLRRIYFGGEPTSAKPVTPPAQPQTSGAESAWSLVKDTTSIAALEAFIARYKGTFHADLARVRIAELKKQEVAVAAPPPTKKPVIPPAAKPAVGVFPQPEPRLQGSLPGNISLAVAGPLTGGNAALGAQLKYGVQLAAEDINAAGGLLGQRITVTVGDDRSDPREGVSIANKFVADGTKFVVGHFNSAVTIPASEVYSENGVLLITPSATNPRVTERNLWNVFRTIGRDDQQGGIAGDIIADRFRGKRVAVLHDKTIYGQGLADEARKAMNTKGLKEMFYESVNRDDKDFGALISKLKGANVDLVYWGGLSSPAGLILRQMRAQGVTATFMGGDGIADDEFPRIAGPDAVGTLMTFHPNPWANPANRGHAQNFRKKYGFEPEGYTLYSYAAVQIIKQAAEQAKSLDSRKVAEIMRSGKIFKTVLGDISYDQKGDVSNTGYIVDGKKKGTYVLNVWKSGPDGKVSFREE